MVSVGAGYAKSGYIPIVDTFGQFGVTKGNLPLTMAALSPLLSQRLISLTPSRAGGVLFHLKQLMEAGAVTPVIALVSGANRLDEAKLAAAAGAARAARVDAERVRAVTGFPIGGVDRGWYS